MWPMFILGVYSNKVDYWKPSSLVSTTTGFSSQLLSSSYLVKSNASLLPMWIK